MHHDEFNDVAWSRSSIGCLALCLSSPWSKFNLHDYFNLL